MVELHAGRDTEQTKLRECLLPLGNSKLHNTKFHDVPRKKFHTNLPGYFKNLDK
jgi:hypothetical protein